MVDELRDGRSLTRFGLSGKPLSRDQLRSFSFDSERVPARP